MKTACSKSWTDVNIDFANRLVRNCCMSKSYSLPDNYTVDFFDNNPFVQQRRQDTLRGIEHPDCEYCWADEREGRNSYRSWMNKYDSFEGCVPENSDVRYIDMTLDTVCDQSCLYCAPDASSQIAQEMGVPIRDAGTEHDFETFKQWLTTLSGSVVINFLGGEPTASKRFAPMVEYISGLDNIDVHFEVCTNGNTKPQLMDRLFETIDASNNSWSVSFSNETVGTDAELTRYGLDWDRFCSNFVRYAQHPKITSITLAATVNTFSLRGFADYIQWVHTTMREYAPNKTFGWVANYVKRPRHLDIKFANPSAGAHVDRAMNVFKQFDNQPNVKNRERFQKFLVSMQQRVGSAHTEDLTAEFVEQTQPLKQKDLSSLL